MNATKQIPNIKPALESVGRIASINFSEAQGELGKMSAQLDAETDGEVLKNIFAASDALRKAEAEVKTAVSAAMKIAAA